MWHESRLSTPNLVIKSTDELHYNQNMTEAKELLGVSK